MIICPRCGCRIENDNAVFCPECDTIVNKDAEVFLSLNKTLEDEKNDPELAKWRKEKRENTYSRDRHKDDDYEYVPKKTVKKESHAGVIVLTVLVVAAIAAYFVFMR